MKEYLLKGKSFWEVKVPQVCSWSWRKILKLRDIARNFIQFKVGDGSGIFMWLVWWHPNGVLYEKFGQRIVYDAGSKVGAKLSSVLREKAWCWQPVRSDELVRIQSKLPMVCIGDFDQPVWNISKKGMHNSSETWETIGFKLPQVD